MNTGPNRSSETGEYAPTQLVCFVVERQGAAPLQAGVDISAVREVLPLRPITPVPLAPAAVLGMFDWRGRIVPAVDASQVIAGSKTSHSPRNRLMVLQTQAGMVAYLVSQVIGIVKAGGDLESVPPEANLDSNVAVGSIPSALGPVILLAPQHGII